MWKNRTNQFEHMTRIIIIVIELYNEVGKNNSVSMMRRLIIK